MLSFSGFLRRLARDSVLAGVEDAMRFLEPQASQDAHSRMVEQLEDRLKRHQQNRPSQATIAAQPAPNLLSRANEDQPTQPGEGPKPESNGQQPTEPKLTPRKNAPSNKKKQQPPHAH